MVLVVGLAVDLADDVVSFFVVIVVVSYKKEFVLCIIIKIEQYLSASCINNYIYH